MQPLSTGTEEQLLTRVWNHFGNESFLSEDHSWKRATSSPCLPNAGPVMVSSGLAGLLKAQRILNRQRFEPQEGFKTKKKVVPVII